MMSIRLFVPGILALIVAALTCDRNASAQGLDAQPHSVVTSSPKTADESLSEKNPRYQEGLRLLEAGNPDKAAEVFLALSGQGHAPSQSALAVLLTLGKGVEKNAAVARDLLLKAASTGYVSAQYNLCDAYYEGTGGPRDEASAVLWCSRAAAKGHVWAKHQLGVMAFARLHEPGSAAEAKIWFGQAAAAGNSSSQWNIGLMLADGLDVPKDETAGYYWIHRAAAAGHWKAQNRYAWCRLAEEPRPSCRTGSKVEALKMLLRAATSGGGDLTALIFNYLFFPREIVEQGVHLSPMDSTDAVSVVMAAAADGVLPARAIFGSMMVLGLGVTADAEIGYATLRGAAGQGDPFAQRMLTVLSDQRKDAAGPNFMSPTSAYALHLASQRALAGSMAEMMCTGGRSDSVFCSAALEALNKF